MAIFELAPALEISRKIVREQANKAVLRLVPDIKGAIFTVGLLALLVINTALAQDAFVLKDLKQQAQVLTDQREAILREVAQKSSPDQLAQSATNLGMVASTNPRFLDMSVGN
jgi:hypothetical protein